MKHQADSYRDRVSTSMTNFPVTESANIKTQGSFLKTKKHPRENLRMVTKSTTVSLKVTY